MNSACSPLYQKFGYFRVSRLSSPLQAAPPSLYIGEHIISLLHHQSYVHSVIAYITYDVYISSSVQQLPHYAQVTSSAGEHQSSPVKTLYTLNS